MLFCLRSHLLVQEEKLVNIGLQTHGRRSVGYPGTGRPQRSNRGSVSVPTAWKEGDARGAAKTSPNRSEESEERLPGAWEGFPGRGHEPASEDRSCRGQKRCSPVHLQVRWLHSAPTGGNSGPAEAAGPPQRPLRLPPHCRIVENFMAPGAADPAISCDPSVFHFRFSLLFPVLILCTCLCNVDTSKAN